MSLDKTDKRTARKNANSSISNDMSPPKEYKLPSEPEPASPHIQLNLHPTDVAEDTDDSVSPSKTTVALVTTPEREEKYIEASSPP